MEGLKGKQREGFPQGYEDWTSVLCSTRSSALAWTKSSLFDSTPHLCSAINIVKETDGLLEKLQRFQFYLSKAGMEADSKIFKQDVSSLLLSLRHVCIQVKDQLEESHQDVDQVTAVLERIDLVQ